MLNCFCVGMGGFIGASARYLLSLIPIQGKSGFPWTTLFINAAGAFLIGCISAFALESYVLMENGKGVLSAIYMAASVLICLGAVMLAQKII